jgi:hypothetical protein
MALVRHNHFSECFADCGIQQASAEIDLQGVLEDSFVEGRSLGVLNLFRGCGQGKGVRLPGSLGRKIAVDCGLKVRSRAGRLRPNAYWRGENDRENE